MSKNGQMQSVVTCDTCEETAEHLCKTCQDRLCSKCKQVHSKSRASFDHEVVLLSSSALSLSKQNKIYSQQVCSKHAGYRIVICCGDCEIPICEKCLLPEHSGHRVISITDLIKKKQPKLNAKYSTVSSYLPQYVKTLREVKERKIKVAQNSHLLREEIEKHFCTVQSEIEKKKMLLLKEVHENYTLIMDKLKIHEDWFEKYIKSMSKFMKEFKSELPNEKQRFILFGNCNVGATLPECVPKITFPELPRYERELNAAAFQSLCGCLSSKNTHFYHCKSTHQGNESPLTSTILSRYSPQQQKQMLKERLFPLISWKYSKWAGNIIGMLLKFDNSELLYMLEYQEVLEARAKEAVAQLEMLQSNTTGHQRYHIY